nr:hypothetical protein [Marinobacter sp. ATCH36]
MIATMDELPTAVGSSLVGTFIVFHVWCFMVCVRG